MPLITITEQPNKTTSQLLNECKQFFPVWCYWDDKELNKSFPAPKEATKRQFKDSVEASQTYANLSYNQLKKRYPNKEWITLRERIIWELEYFKKTGSHLDIKNWTLCAGSRSVGGYVPDCYSGGDRFGVYDCGPDYAFPDLRAREVVSTLDSQSLLPIHEHHYQLARLEYGYEPATTSPNKEMGISVCTTCGDIIKKEIKN